MNMKLLALIWTSVVFLALPFSTAAQDLDIRLNLDLPPDAISLGEGAAYKVIFEGSGSLPSGKRLNHFLMAKVVGYSSEGEQIYNSEEDGVSSYRISQLERALPALATAFKSVPMGSIFRLWLSASAIPENSRALDAVDQVVDFHVIEFALPFPPPPDVAAIPESATLTESGVGFKTLNAGDGETHPTLDDNLTVHYSGWTGDGQMFGSTHLNDRAATFPLGILIQGWQDAIPLMTLGEKARIWIPGALAYDNREDRPFAPKGMLIFDVELLEITPTPEEETE